MDPVWDHLFRILNYVSQGGIVMYPLLGISFVMWILIIDRTFFFRRLYRKNITRKKAAEFIIKGIYPDPDSYTGITSSLVRTFLLRRKKDKKIDPYIMDEVVIEIVSSLDKHLKLIEVLASIAPLLGLLGTVIGMIKTFDVISYFGTGNAKAMAAGISEALITTQTGLMIAIPGLYMSNFLNRRAEELKRRVASVGMFLRRYV